jgi:hypothetical protein
MTSRLWIFGDSYGCDMPGHHLHQRKPPVPLSDLLDFPIWPASLARYLGLSYSNYSASGSAMEYSRWQWHQQRSNFSSGDLVVLVLTNPNRAWLDRDDVCETDVSVWIDHYGKANFGKIYNIFDPELRSVSMADWLGHVVLHAQQHDYRVLAIPCFQESLSALREFSRGFDHNIKGFTWTDFYLFQVSQWELGQEWSDKAICGLTAGDIRTGHLCLSNHRRLTNVLFDALYSGRTCYSVDFRKKFLGKILSRDSLSDNDFLAKELGPWYRSHQDSISRWKRF